VQSRADRAISRGLRQYLHGKRDFTGFPERSAPLREKLLTPKEIDRNDTAHSNALALLLLLFLPPLPPKRRRRRIPAYPSLATDRRYHRRETSSELEEARAQSRWRNRTAEVLKCKCSSPRRIRDQSTRLVSFARSRHGGSKNHEQSRLAAEFFGRRSLGDSLVDFGYKVGYKRAGGPKFPPKSRGCLELPVKTRTESYAARPSSVINHDRISDLRSRRLGSNLCYNPGSAIPPRGILAQLCQNPIRTTRKTIKTAFLLLPPLSEKLEARRWYRRSRISPANFLVPKFPIRKLPEALSSFPSPPPPGIFGRRQISARGKGPAIVAPRGFAKIRVCAYSPTDPPAEGGD